MKQLAFVWRKLTSGTGRKILIAFFVRGLGCGGGRYHERGDNPYLAEFTLLLCL